MDINKYTTSRKKKNPEVWVDGEFGKIARSTGSAVLRMIWKGLKTFLFVGGISGCIVLLAVASYVWSFRDTSTKALTNLTLDYSSTIFVPDKTGATFKEYMSLYSTENRVWVDFDDIGKTMCDAMTAIEDKRFYEHKGVDWKTTLGAVYKLASGQSGGGSTITQQLIKNITGQNDVSVQRKIKEIFMALNLEKEYTKEEILEAYLNIVNFGSGCYGAQSAAKKYFGKDVGECSVAQCAAIAAITQNPTKYNPLRHPEENYKRQVVVIEEMYAQEKITERQYKQALIEAQHMEFSNNDPDAQKEEVLSAGSVWNWYVEAVFAEIVEDLQEQYDYSYEKAVEMIYHDGLNIYSAMDVDLQTAVEQMLVEEYEFYDEKIKAGFCMMDYNGKVMAIVGDFEPKKSNRVFSYATDAKRQVGSTFKPISVYSTALSLGEINYSTLLPDEPIEGYYGSYSSLEGGPRNWSGKYEGTMTVAEALQISYNAPAAQLCKMVGSPACYDFVTSKLGLSYLKYGIDNNQISSMALGGMEGGCTVEEITAAYAIFGNGGYYYEPYTYFYVTDHDGNVILDNRNEQPTQALTTTNSTIMWHLLHEPVYGRDGTGTAAQISGVEIYGKTGTTNDDYDSWFAGGTPYGVAAIWSGYQNPSRLSSTRDAIQVWKKVMTYMKEIEAPETEYVLDASVYAAEYCNDTGLLAGENCTDKRTGYYTFSTLPKVCEESVEMHKRHQAGETFEQLAQSPSPSPSPSPSTKPSVAPEPSGTPKPSLTPSPTITP